MNSEHLLHEAVLENLGEALIIINARGVIERFTFAAEKLFLYSREEVIGKNVSVLMPDDIGSIHQGYVDNYHSTDRSTVLGRTRELIARRKDGHQFPVQITVTRVPLNDRTIFVGLLKDISEKVETIKRLNAALDEANVANKAKSEFIENMCHEVRTPMNGVLGTLQLLHKIDLAPEAKRFVDIALTSSELLLRILNDVLDFSKIDAEKFPLEIRVFSVLDLLNDVSSSMKKAADDKGIEIHLVDLPTQSVLRLGDEIRVKQILNNILSNAIKFSDEGPICLTTNLTEHSIQFVVSDNGIGMSEQQCQRIFERFSQADTSISRKYGGTGLGMTIVAKLVELMNGDINVKSQLGKGTTISVELPLATADDTERNTCPLPVELPLFDLTGKTILVADDNEMNLLVTTEMLKDTNARVIEVKNGLEAVTQCLKEDIDLVLMDINMPEMDGKTALKQIRQNSFIQPIIALTASAGLEQVNEFRELGFNDVLPKPISISVLYECLRKYC